MSYFIVHQNQTFEEEYKGGYLWAPQKGKNNKTFFHWTNMTRVKKDDIIFSSYKKAIVSINIALDKCSTREKPPELQGGNEWNSKGWFLRANYNILDNPLKLNTYMNDILKRCPEKYSPFTKQGKGTQGYLFEIPDELGEYLLYIIKKSNENFENLENIIENQENAYIENVENNSFYDNETEKDVVIKARIGQGKFRSKLLLRSCKCELCELNIEELLRASHCKPWKYSDNFERLDSNNGLLLCPTHDALFDKGLITFDDMGNIKISSKIEPVQYNLLMINSNMTLKITLNEEQKKYLKWNNENIFIK